jgi:hypothetical protein
LQEPAAKEKPTKQRAGLVNSDGAVGKQQGQAVPQPLKRTYAIFLESDDESNDDEAPQTIEDVMTSVHSRYPAMNFFQYIAKLKDRGVLYLSTAAHFDSEFYKGKIGMSEGAAYTFHSYVANAYRKVQWGRSKGKKARISS